MFALNGGNGIWNYNAESQSVSVLGQKVGIGTSTPTALLEVVGTGGDDSVKLPAGSVGLAELGSDAHPRCFQITTSVTIFSTTKTGQLLISGVGTSPAGPTSVVVVDGTNYYLADHNSGLHSIHRVIPLTPGTHTLVYSDGGGNYPFGVTGVWFAD